MKKGTLLLLATASITAIASMTTVASAQSKERTYDEMLALTAQMHELKPLVAENPAVAALYQNLQAAYKEMSDRLGGADPGSTFSVKPQPAAGQTPPNQTAQRNLGGIAGGGGIAGAPGCAFDSDLAASFPALAIPDEGTVSDTITISGLPGTVWYVDSIMDISHTFPGDLDIKLTSPSGTTITISSNNGGEFDNVFGDGAGPNFGTYFNDGANPGGALPYATNDGLVTDHAYVNGMTADPLCPEEAFAAFIGEDPNGVWTLTVADEAGGDVGTLHSWDLLVVTIPPTNARTGTLRNPTDVAIPSGPAVVSSSITVANFGGFICDVKVRTDITHKFASDLDITLTSPTGRVVTLTTDNGGDLANVFAGTVWNDDVDPGAPGARSTTDATYVSLVVKNALTPEEPLRSLLGASANGVWTLTISDDFFGEGGTLNEWSLQITTCSCGPGCGADINGDGVTDVNDLLLLIGGWGLCP